MANYSNTSKIIRQADVTKNFSIIPNHIAQSTELSPNAKSLIIHLLSMPDNWYYVKTQFWKKTNLGRDAFNRAWKELEEIGYICSERIIEGNLVRGYNYVISDLPIFGCTEIQLNRSTDNPNISKQLNTNAKKTNKQNTNSTNSISKLPKGNLDYSNAVAAVEEDFEYYNQEKMSNKESSLVDDSHHIYSVNEFQQELLKRLNK